jgi:hypothetical protein
MVCYRQRLRCTWPFAPLHRCVALQAWIACLRRCRSCCAWQPRARLRASCEHAPAGIPTVYLCAVQSFHNVLQPDGFDMANQNFMMGHLPYVFGSGCCFITGTNFMARARNCRACLACFSCVLVPHSVADLLYACHGCSEGCASGGHAHRPIVRPSGS